MKRVLNVLFGKEGTGGKVFFLNDILSTLWRRERNAILRYKKRPRY